MEATEGKRSSPATPPAQGKSQIPRSTAAAPLRETRVRLVKPKVAAPAAPVLSPRLAPIRRKSDDAKSRVGEELVP